MEFRHIRGNAIILFDKITKLPLLIVILVSLFIIDEFDPQILFAAFFLVLSPLAGIAKYVSTYYTIEEEQLVVEKGIFSKKRMEIPLRQITTVDLSQNILYQLFRTYKIKVDNASQTSDTIHNAEVILALKENKAFEFKRLITQIADSEKDLDENFHDITAANKDFIKLGLLRSKIIYFFTGAPIVVPVITGIIFVLTGTKDVDVFLDKVTGENSKGFTTVFIIILFFYFTALVVSLFQSMFTYYNFRISGSTDVLKIEYGLFGKKKFTFQKRKINGILLKQNLLMRLFKCYSVEILIIGYGENSDEESEQLAILYPIASVKKIENIIKQILPQFKIEYSIYKPDKKAKRYFIYRPGFMSAVLIFAISLFTNLIYLIAPALAILILAAGSIILQYHNSGIFSTENNVTLSFGGYHKTVAIIQTSSIESISAQGSIFKRKNGIVSIGIGFVAPLRSANITALNLPEEQYKLLESVIKY